jgi:hypothetical protein
MASVYNTAKQLRPEQAKRVQFYPTKFVPGSGKPAVYTEKRMSTIKGIARFYPVPGNSTMAQQVSVAGFHSRLSRVALNTIAGFNCVQ